MILVFGLGNPDTQYMHTRHNIGYRVINELAKGISFKTHTDLYSDIASVGIADHRVLLGRSHTYMNVSGKAVALVAEFYKIPHKNIWIVHDDVDLLFGSIRIGASMKPAGHKGVYSIIQSLGANDFNRMRIGIWNLPQDQKNAERTRSYVLERFTDEEEEQIPEILTTTIQIFTTAIEKGIPVAQNAFHSK